MVWLNFLNFFFQEARFIKNSRQNILHGVGNNGLSYFNFHELFFLLYEAGRSTWVHKFISSYSSLVSRFN